MNVRAPCRVAPIPRRPALDINQNPHLHVTGRMYQTMRSIRNFICSEVRASPEWQRLTKCCGASPTRPPPPPGVVSALRGKLAAHLGMTPNEADEHHESAPWRFNILQHVLTAAGDPDEHCATWLEHGAPVGVMKELRPGGHFPRLCEGATLDVEELDGVVRWTSNHPSFAELHGEDRSPGISLVEQNVNAGLGRFFTNQASAEKWLGKKAHPAPLATWQNQKTTERSNTASYKT